MVAPFGGYRIHTPTAHLAHMGASELVSSLQLFHGFGGLELMALTASVPALKLASHSIDSQRAGLVDEQLAHPCQTKQAQGPTTSGYIILWWYSNF